MNNYFAYGLKIQSEIPFPELLPCLGVPDVTITVQEAKSASSKALVDPIWHKFTREEVLFSAEGMTFRVLGGREVIITTGPDGEPELIRIYLSAILMVLLLYQRGHLVLHASSVEIDDSAVAFLGDPGLGKSSLAASLYARAHCLLADDVTALDLGADSLRVLPGFPFVKISNELAQFLGFNKKSLFSFGAYESKRGLSTRDRMPQSPVALKKIYILSDGEEPGITLVAPHAAMMELLRYTCPTRYFQPPDATHFLQCAQLVNSVPIYRVARALNISRLPELACRIEDDLSASNGHSINEADFTERGIRYESVSSADQHHR